MDTPNHWYGFSDEHPDRRQDETLRSVFSAALDTSEDRERLAETLRELVRRCQMRMAITAAGLEE